MLNVIASRLQQKHRTMKYPYGSPPDLPDRFRGRPTINASRCLNGCSLCSETCPTGAITATDKVRIDLGKCLFCAECLSTCPTQAIAFTNDYRLAARNRTALIIEPNEHETPSEARLDDRLVGLFGRSLKLRQVSAGGCNACEADTNVLGTVGWDLGRFSIQFVASPRHADGILITGPVSQNMRLGLEKTFHAVPEPKIVIAVGACAISGGPYINHSEVNNGAGNILHVDLYVPGCPPHPLTILDGLLRLLGKI